MKRQQIGKATKQRLTKSLTVGCIVLGGVAACGGGGSNSATSASTAGAASAKSLSGSVIDGAIEGASVCLDLNSNQLCDAGEQDKYSAITKADGSYTLDTSGLTAEQLQNAHILVNVPATAKDADDGGKTLADAGKEAFVLMAPVAGNGLTPDDVTGVIVSPVTTLVSHNMVKGGMSVEQATANVQKNLGLSSDVSLTQDPSKSDALRATAQIIAAAIGVVQKSAKDSGTTNAAVSDRVALMAALDYIQSAVAALKMAIQGPGNTSIAADVKAQLTDNTSLKPTATNLVKAAQQQANSATVNLVTILAEGWYTECLECTPATYYKTTGDASSWKDQRYSNSSSGWAESANSTSQSLRLTASGWTPNSLTTGGTWTQEGSISGTAVSTDGADQLRFTVRTQDIAGKTSAEFGINNTNATFPAGSKANILSALRLMTKYTIYTGFKPGAGGGGQQYTSIAQLIDAKQTPATASTAVNIEGSNGLHFTFNQPASTAASAKGGSVQLYACSVPTETNSGCMNGTWNLAGTASFSISTVHGQEILQINAPYDRLNSRLIYSVDAGKLYGGEAQLSGVWSDDVSFNKTAFNAILAAKSLPGVIN